MSEENSNLIIKAQLDTTGMTSNADDAASALDKLGEAGRGMGDSTAESMAKTMDKAATTADKLAKVERLMIGLQSLSTGGDLAATDLLGGVEVFASFLGPEGEVVAGAIAIVSSLVDMAAALNNANSAAQAQANTEIAAAKKIGDAQAALNELVQQGYDERAQAAEASFSAIASAYDTEQTKVNTLIGAIRDLQRAQDVLTNAKLASKMAELDAKEEQEERGKTPEQQKAIKQKYDTERLNVRQEAGQEQALAEINSGMADRDQAQHALDAKRNELTDLQRKADEAKNALELSGVAAPSDLQIMQKQKADLEWKNKTPGGLSGQDIVDYENIKVALPAVEEMDKINGPQYTISLANLEDQRAAAQKDVKEDRDKETLSHSAIDQAMGKPLLPIAMAKVDDLQAQINHINVHNSAQTNNNNAQATLATAQKDAAPELVKLASAVQIAETLLTAAMLNGGTLVQNEATARHRMEDARNQPDVPSQPISALPNPQVARGQPVPQLGGGSPANEAPPLLEPLVETRTAGAQAMQAATQAHAQLVSSLQSFTDDGQKLAELMTDLARATDKATKTLGHRISVAEAAIASLKTVIINCNDTLKMLKSKNEGRGGS